MSMYARLLESAARARDELLKYYERPVCKECDTRAPMHKKDCSVLKRPDAASEPSKEGK